jgi:uncharacterized protein
METRSYQSPLLPSKEDGKLIVTALAIPYNKQSRPLDMGNGRKGIEIIVDGAFDDSLRNNAGTLFLSGPEHNGSTRLCIPANGSLVTERRSDGIWIKATLPDTSFGRDVYTLVDTGYLPEASFTFDQAKDSWKREGETFYRSIHKANLKEFTFTGIGAYPDTKTFTRSLESAKLEEPEIVVDPRFKLIEILTLPSIRKVQVR